MIWNQSVQHGNSHHSTFRWREVDHPNPGTRNKDRNLTSSHAILNKKIPHTFTCLLPSTWTGLGGVYHGKNSSDKVADRSGLDHCWFHKEKSSCLASISPHVQDTRGKLSGSNSVPKNLDTLLPAPVCLCGFVVVWHCLCACVT